jgi:hypothetical protein
MADGEYGIVANVIEVDRAFRLGGKAWMANYYSGGERASWIAMSRGGRVIAKDAAVMKFGKFRCKWIPEHLRAHIWDRGTREEMEKKAAFWNERAEQARKDHPNRKFQKPALTCRKGD